MRPFPPALVLALLACPPALRGAAAPAWVQGGGVDVQAYPPARYLVGYGLSAPGGSEAEQRRQALDMARAALAAAIRTRVSAEFTAQVTQRDQAMSRFAQNVVRTRADLELTGLDSVLTWQDTRHKTTHALAVLDKPRTLQLLQERMADQAAACRSAFAAAPRDPAGLVQALRLRAQLDEDRLVAAVLAPGAAPATPACPDPGEIERALRAAWAARPGLEGAVAGAALDLGRDLPRGTRVLVDRITYADTPFCGSLSAYLERALADRLADLGQVRILDKGALGDLIRAGHLDADPAQALRSQAVVRGSLFELGDQVQARLRATAPTGEELAAATLALPKAQLAQAGLQLVPDNFQEASQALALQQAQVQASVLRVKLATDRGDGGIYRKGERLHLFLKANQDCYVKVLYQQADGSKVLIYPNKYQPDSRIERDRIYQVPPDGSGFDFVVQEPYGVELVQVLASTEPIDVRTGAPDANGMRAVQEDLASLLGRARGITVRKAEAQYAEATAVVNTMASEVGPSR